MKVFFENHETHEMTRKKAVACFRKSRIPFVLLSCVWCVSWFQFSGALAATNETKEVLPPCCRPIAAQTNYTDKSLFLLESTWTSDANRKVKLGVLRGRPQVVAMFFASCQFTCPLTVSDLKNIEAALPENVRTNTGFLLVSFDNVRDTPAALKIYRAKRELSNANWTLLRGEPDDVRELAALLGVIYKQDAKGDFAHSNVITVLNAEGEIVFQQPGLNVPPDEVVAKIKSVSSP
jgi:protein SCO1/2